MNGKTAGDASGATGQQSCGALRENRRRLLPALLAVLQSRPVTRKPKPASRRLLVGSQLSQSIALPSSSACDRPNRPKDAPFSSPVPAITCALTALLPVVGLVFAKLVSMIALPSFGCPRERAGPPAATGNWSQAPVKRSGINSVSIPLHYSL